MRILVTGGAGYIGTTLVPLLLAQGSSVRVIDNLMNNNGLGLISCFRNPRLEFIRGDIRDISLVREAMKDCDIIIHLAAVVGFPACRKDPDLARTVNVGGTKIIAEVAGRERPVLFGSTGSNYGAVTDELCTEETPLNPVSLYGRTKVEAERHLLENCNTIAYRFATAFGISPRLRLDLLINDFVYTALKLRYLVVYEAHFMRSFIHVYDIARSFLFAIEHSELMRGQVYNVGSENMNFSKAEICDLIQKRIPYYLHFADVDEDADKRNYAVSYKKIKALGYETKNTVEDGIDELVRSFKAINISHPFSNV
jgi:nucleoside-diphosphate-sugar epimerase